MNNRQINSFRFDNEIIRMESALIAGKEPDRNNTSMYIGSLNLDEFTKHLFLINSGILKILTKELDIDLDDCDDFLLSAVTEALVYEWNLHNGENFD